MEYLEQTRRSNEIVERMEYAVLQLIRDMKTNRTDELEIKLQNLVEKLAKQSEISINLLNDSIKFKLINDVLSGFKSVPHIFEASKNSNILMNNYELLLKEIMIFTKSNDEEKKKIEDVESESTRPVLNLMRCHEYYIKLDSSIQNFNAISYLEYLKNFWDFGTLEVKTKINSSFLNYLELLEQTLIEFYLKTNPLIDVYELSNELNKQFLLARQNLETVGNSLPILQLYSNYWCEFFNKKNDNHFCNICILFFEDENKLIDHNKSKPHLRKKNYYLKQDSNIDKFCSEQIEYVMELEFSILMYIDKFSDDIEKIVNKERLVFVKKFN